VVQASRRNAKTFPIIGMLQATLESPTLQLQLELEN